MSTHFVGKSDFGYGTQKHMPPGRGYETSLGYSSHDNDEWTHTHGGGCGYEEHGTIDLFEGRGICEDVNPARSHANHPNCTWENRDVPPGARCEFQEEMFVKEVIGHINNYQEGDRPQFMCVRHCSPTASSAIYDTYTFIRDSCDRRSFWAPHTMHQPIQPPSVPANWSKLIPNEKRRDFQYLLHWMDSAIGRVVTALKAKGMWSNTLLVVASGKLGVLRRAG